MDIAIGNMDASYKNISFPRFDRAPFEMEILRCAVFIPLRYPIKTRYFNPVKAMLAGTAERETG